MSPVVSPAALRALLCVGFVLLLLAGCNSGSAPPLGPDANPDALPAQMGQSNGGGLTEAQKLARSLAGDPAPAPTPPPAQTQVQAPPRLPSTNSTPPGPNTPKKWTPGEPQVKELAPLAVLIAIDPNSSFDQLSEQFTRARADKRVLDNGHCELELLYNTALATEFRNKPDLESRIAFFNEWKTAKPQDATPLLLLAKLHHAIGWAARGGGAGAEVGEAQFKIFHDQLRQGLVYAQAAESLKPADPELYAVLLGLGQGLSVKKKHFETWVDAGRQIQPNYYSLYEQAAFNLLPRWHGEPGDVEKMAEDLYTKIGGEDGAEAYARCAMAVMPYDRDILSSGQFDLKKVVAGAEVMGRRYPQETSFLPFLTVMAWHDQNQPLARKYIERYIKVGKPESNILNFRYDQVYGFCECECPPDKADAIHWPYMNRVEQMVYINGGRGYITVPSAKWEMIRIWDRDDLTGPQGAIPELPEKVTALQTDANGKRLILSAGNGVNGVDISISLEQAVEPVIYQGAGQRLGTALSPDGKHAATCRNATITIWDPATGQKQLDLAGEFEHAVMKFSPDSQRLLIVSRGSIELFDPTNGNLLYKHAKPAGGATLNRTEHFIDGKSLLGYGNSTSGVAALVKWFPEENKVVELVREGGARYVTVNDVSRNYVLCSEVGRLGPIFHLFRLSDGKKIRTVDGHQTRVVSSVISPNETEFATADLAGPIRFWKITP